METNKALPMDEVIVSSRGACVTVELQGCKMVLAQLVAEKVANHIHKAGHDICTLPLSSEERPVYITETGCSGVEVANKDGDGWRPISEAPSGVNVIVYVKDHDGPDLVGEAYQNEETGLWWWANQNAGDYHAEAIDCRHGYPTHWQPLPQPPERQE